MKKLISFFGMFIFSFCALSALSGFKVAVPDLPGEYVYYHDLSFENESYVGFLTYDEKTYSARYYSPVQNEKKLPEKEVQIFFTINPNADHIEFTGEKILNIQMLSEDDTQIVNYLHDLVYEFSARRAKVFVNTNDSNLEKTFTQEDYAQFGGPVQIGWNTLIPLFNVESIYSENDAKKTFYVVTMGRITNSEDKSFENFKGFSCEFKAKKHNVKINKKAKMLECVNKTTENQYSIYSDWKRAAENVFMLGDTAVFMEGKTSKTNETYLNRSIVLSSGENYLDFESLTFKDGLFKANYVNFQSKNVTTSLKKIQKNAESEDISWATLSVFCDVYKKNPKYFEKIIESFNSKD